MRYCIACVKRERKGRPGNPRHSVRDGINMDPESEISRYGGAD